MPHDWWERRDALPNEGPPVPPLADDGRIRDDIDRLRKHGERLDATGEALVEMLASRCSHTPEPCQRCTDLALWSVLALSADQIRRPSTPQETR